MINTLTKEITNAKDMNALRTAMVAWCEHFSFDFIFYNIQLANSFEEVLFFGVGNYSTSWMERYSKQDYAKVDPVLIHCLQSEDAIFWKHCHDSKNKILVDFFQDASRYGLVDGVSRGLRKSPSELGILSLAKKTDLTDKAILPQIEKIQPLIHDGMIRLSSSYKESKSTLLTAREKEALHLMAEGKTSAQIAKAMYVSESTAIFHIKNIIEKLDATNRTQAVARAVLIGLISPKDYHDKQQHNYRWEDV